MNDVATDAATDAATDDRVLFEERGLAGLIFLNRPKALNALSLSMIEAIMARLDRWEAEDRIAHIVIVGLGERAFCAGGDIREIYEVSKVSIAAAERYFRREYDLDLRIRSFSKPWISVLDGLVMGGGAGISINGTHRVAFAGARFAMPETGIGFFPDVGASRFLSHCPPGVGMFLGLTGTVVGAAEMTAFGLATHSAGDGDPERLLDLLAQTRDVSSALADFSSPPPACEANEDIPNFYMAATIHDLAARLDESSNPWAVAQGRHLATRSPWSLATTHRLLRQGGELASFEETMAVDYRLARHFLRRDDFYEGVRCAVIDKTRKPQWRPERIEDVDAALIDRQFTSDPEPDIPTSATPDDADR